MLQPVNLRDDAISTISPLSKSIDKFESISRISSKLENSRSENIDKTIADSRASEPVRGRAVSVGRLQLPYAAIDSSSPVPSEMRQYAVYGSEANWKEKEDEHRGSIAEKKWWQKAWEKVMHLVGISLY